MSHLSRFLPKFLRGDKSNGQTASDKSLCKIMFLDDTEYFIPYKGGLKGQYVLDKAFEQLNLFEKDYFGLRYIDLAGQTHWLDSNKPLSAQLKGCAIPYTLYFGVKFYPADPCKLKEEITRYQFFLQVKKDILHGRLPVTFEEAAELFAYAVQSELGDVDSQKLPPGYVSEFQFVPNQTEELEENIAALHRRLGGTVPATAELKFLDKVKWLDMYGVDLHPVMGESNTEYFLGLTPTGIVVYKNKTKVGNYFWPRITKVNMKGKVFIVKVKDKINEEHVYAFELATKAACKHLFKCCIEHHSFFRINQLGAPSTLRNSKPNRSTAKHRNSGRQERQSSTAQNGREQPQVLRVQSRRQARRAMSDTRLNHGGIETGIQYSEGHVTMVVNPEQVKGSRHRSLPDLKDRGSPTSTRSAPWENNVDTGLYTSGRESPVSVTQSENVNYLRRHRDSDSEAGYRRKYFPSSRKGSDNESDVSFTRRRRRDCDSGSESDISSKYTFRQRKTKSVGPDTFERDWKDAMQHMYLPNKENGPNESVPSLHSAPLGESRQKKMRRRRSKSPGNRRPPEELRQHIEFDLVEPSDEMTEDQLREIPYVNVETKAEAFKVKYSPSNRRRYRSPKRKSFGDFEGNMKSGYSSDVQSQKYNRAPDRTPEPVHKQFGRLSGGYYSDTGSPTKPRQSVSPYKYQCNNTLPTHSKPIEADPVIDQRNDPSISDLKVSGQNSNISNTEYDKGHQGQGRDIVDRSNDVGINYSQGSVGTVMNIPSHNQRHKFGTQDAIARLYSSPAGTRKPLNTGNQQNSGASNQNTPKYRNTELMNESSFYNQPSTYSHMNLTNQQAADRHRPDKSPHGRNGYDKNSNIVKTVISPTEPLNRSGVQFQKHDHNQHQLEPNLQSRLVSDRQSNLMNRKQNYSSSDYFYHEGQNDRPTSGSGFIQSNGYPRNASSYNQQAISDFSVKSQTSHYTPDYRPDNLQGKVQSPNVGSWSTNQSRYSPQKPLKNYAGNQSSFDNNQSTKPWQYVNNGRYPSNDSRNTSDNVDYRHKSNYNRSQAQSEDKRNRRIELVPTQDFRDNSTRQSPSKAPSFQSPDSAISSVTNSSPSSVNYSPTKNAYSSRLTTNSQSNESYSRTQTPAFGLSEKWTEL